jgi:hypothetical protein
MRYEFYGSFGVFLASFLMIIFRSSIVRLAITAILFGDMASVSMFYFPFGAGLALAWVQAPGWIRIPIPIDTVMVS